MTHRRARALALLPQRRYAQAADALRKVVAADAADTEAWCALGDALHALGRLDAACDAYRASLDGDAARFAAWWGLGCAQARRGEPALAADAMEHAAALRPERAAVWHNLGKAWHELGRVEDAIDAMRRAAALDPQSLLPLQGIAVAIPGDPRADAAAIREARRAWTARAFAGIRRMVRPPPVDEAAPRRLRIGYLSAFFRHRNWMKPVWPLVHRHDRGRFDVHLLSDDPPEAIGGYQAHERDRFVPLAGLDDARATARIAALDLDLLIDLNGYSAPERLGVVAAHPARRVVGWFNSFATSGLDAYDAVIADDVVAPPQAPAEFEEPLVRVPFSHLTFRVDYPTPDVAPPPVLERGRLTFGCLAQTYKLVPGMVQTLACILLACPGSRLVLQASALRSAATRAFLQDRFAQHGVAADALVLHGPAEHFDFLRTYAQVDVSLETFPYGGATTAMESLWQGVPVLTFAGDRWAGRLSASLLRHAGLDAFVVADAQAYVDAAVALFHDPATPQRLAVLRSGLRHRLQASPACDCDGFARAMEVAYTRILQTPPRGG